MKREKQVKQIFCSSSETKNGHDAMMIGQNKMRGYQNFRQMNFSRDYLNSKEHLSPSIGLLAQLVEHRIPDPKVISSSLVGVMPFF
jgi:hypothetical protein